MSGPKHLWSGDWRDESASVPERLADRERTPPVDGASASPAPRARRALPIVIASVLLLGGAAYGLTTLLGSSANRAPAVALGPSVHPASTSTALSRPVNWLGMEIVTVPPGAAVVETVRQGSGGDRAGLSPGDVIVEINSRSIHGSGDIDAALGGLRAGARVTLQISHGSSLYETEATLAAPPSIYP
jgi:S1-C subfamily serine protease